VGAGGDDADEGVAAAAPLHPAPLLAVDDRGDLVLTSASGVVAAAAAAAAAAVAAAVQIGRARTSRSAMSTGVAGHLRPDMVAMTSTGTIALLDGGAGIELHALGGDSGVGSGSGSGDGGGGGEEAVAVETRHLSFDNVRCSRLARLCLLDEITRMHANCVNNVTS
jgi:hypothetical protein